MAVDIPTSAAYVFVYGTLRRGQLRDITRLQPGLVCLGQGRVAGVLYDLGDYPGLLLADSCAALGHKELPEQVCGELYPLSWALEQELDVIEEFWPQSNGEYRKRVVEVDTPVQGGLLVRQALLYEVLPERTVGKRRIAGGDWLADARVLD